ncbi:MAG TPA: UDP-N-acetylmuramate dehydrogenase [Candidatus Krumholzibacteria bacterium]|nr:UDP-N-acetylmuramate dehydrogenase [Candidatus Krumholzibacteria bacterium]
MTFHDDLHRVTGGRVKTQEPLDRHTTFRIGGPAEYYVAPRSEAEVGAVCALAQAANVPLRVLGNGSNLIVPDAGVTGIVLHVARALAGVERNDHEVHAGAGLPLVQLMQFAARQGLEGMEWACGIPGTVGGALLTNAGTPAGEMSDVTTRIRVVERDGNLRELAPGDFAFAYRKSSLRERGCVAVGATVRLQPGDRDAIFERIKTYNQRRLLTQPVGTWNSGCIFKNCPPHRIGQEIDRAGLKGRRVGHASVSTVHGNFIVNEGGARAADVLELIACIKHELEPRLGVHLEEEVEIWS